jgi:hypothetical protein
VRELYDESRLNCVTGFLTGAYKSVDDFEEGDMRRFNPRFQGETFKENLKLVDALKYAKLLLLFRTILIYRKGDRREQRHHLKSVDVGLGPGSRGRFYRHPWDQEDQVVSSILLFRYTELNMATQFERERRLSQYKAHKGRNTVYRRDCGEDQDYRGAVRTISVTVRTMVLKLLLYDL